MREISEGDVFRFAYHHREEGRDYSWCFDGQLVATKDRFGNIFLRDTYWSDGREFGPTEAEQKGTLTFLFNLNDVRGIHDYETRYYDAKDVFDFSHQHGCYRRFVVKKDAMKSRETMLVNISAEIVKTEREIQWASDSLARLLEKKKRIEDGDVNVDF